MNRYKSKYRPTGNLVVDLVGACKSHYEWQHRKVERIRLCSSYWKEFTDYVKRHAPESFYTDYVDFDETQIIKGHMFMIKTIEVDLQQVKTEA